MLWEVYLKCISFYLIVIEGISCERDFLSLCSPELSLHTRSDWGLVSKTLDTWHDMQDARLLLISFTQCVWSKVHHSILACSALMRNIWGVRVSASLYCSLICPPFFSFHCIKLVAGWASTSHSDWSWATSQLTPHLGIHRPECFSQDWHPWYRIAPLGW